jgi:hypothetical protein
LRVTKAVTGVTYDYSATVVIGDPDSTEGDDADCGAFWHVVCYAELLFVPDAGTFEDNWTDMSDAANDNYPFGPALWVTGTISDGMYGFEVGTDYGQVHPDVDSASCVGTPSTLDTPVGEIPVPDLTIPYSGDCDDSDKPGFILTMQTWSLRLSSIVFAFGFLMFVKRQIGRLTGDGDEGGEAE